jgi:glycosyltransferase involved in cell wall biosynthesis
MKISVAMATFNGEKYILEQLESLASQTVKPFELVVCDDQSTDKTYEIIEEFSKKSPFTIHLHQNPERINYVLNFLKAASLCAGDLIAYCDQDDIWFDNKLECSLIPFQDPEVLLAVHTHTLVDERLKELNNGKPKSISRSRVANPLNINPLLLPSGHAMIFSRCLLNFIHHERPQSKMGAYRQTHEEIVYLFASILGKTAFLNKSFCLYRQHSSNVSGISINSNTIQDSMNVGSQDYEHQTQILHTYATYLKNIASKYNDLNISSKLTIGATFYEKAACNFERRSSLYRASSSYEKLSKFILMLLSNTYCSREQGGLGVRSLCKDFLEATLGVERWQGRA